MSISDIITLVSLALAVVAILNEKNRLHLLLKLRVVDYYFFGISFALINYFVFYESFYSWKIFIPQLYFENFGLKNPKNYSYAITLLSISYFFFKIWWSFYPRSKGKNVFQFYRRLIENEEVPYLLDLMERYHKVDIINYLQNFKEGDNESMIEPYHKVPLNERIKIYWQKSIAYLFPLSSANRETFARSILLGTMNDPSFVSLASNKRPHFFAELYCHFKENKRRSFPNELVNRFLKELLLHKNFWLIKELKASQDHDYGQPEWFFEQNPIIGGLLDDVGIAHVNQIWQPFGDIAIDEIQEHRLYGYESKLFTEFRDEQFLWEYKTYMTIQLFFIMLIEAIKKNYNSHFWIQYYSLIVKQICKTLEKYPDKNIETNTVYHKFIELIIENLMELIRFANRNNKQIIFGNLITNLGWSVNSITRVEIVSSTKAKEIIKSLLNLYCNLENNENVTLYRENLETMLNEPSNTDDNAPYLTLFKDVWENDFDKIPHYNNVGDYDYFDRLKTEVIIPLGFDPEN